MKQIDTSITLDMFIEFADKKTIKYNDINSKIQNIEYSDIIYLDSKQCITKNCLELCYFIVRDYYQVERAVDDKWWKEHHELFFRLQADVFYKRYSKEVKDYLVKNLNKE